MTGRARVADLSVVPSIAARDDEFWAAVRDAVCSSPGGRCLSSPEGHRADLARRWSSPGRTVWRRSAPSTAAEPFFAKAKQRQLLSVAEDDEDDPSLAAMAEYLTLSPVSSVETSRIAATSDRIAKALLLEASAKTPGDAVGHGRLRPLAMARMGVWRRHRRGAAHTIVPVLMAH